MTDTCQWPTTAGTCGVPVDLHHPGALRTYQGRSVAVCADCTRKVNEYERSLQSIIVSMKGEHRYHQGCTAERGKDD